MALSHCEHLIHAFAKENSYDLSLETHEIFSTNTHTSTLCFSSYEIKSIKNANLSLYQAIAIPNTDESNKKERINFWAEKLNIQITASNECAIHL